MKNSIKILLLATFLGLAMSTSFKSSARQDGILDNGAVDAPEYVPYICPAHGSDAEPIFCPLYIRDACVCYKNGTCVNTQSNRCSDCQLDDVISVTEGQVCPTDTLDGEYFKCEPIESEEPVICTLELHQGCTCYNNGTCIEGLVKACADCQRSEIALIIEDGPCPANGIQPREEIAQEESGEADLLTGGQNEETEDYVPYICPDYTGIQINCALYIRDACVCYRNGTCVDTQANSCVDCQNDEIVSVTEGQTCPAGTLDGEYTRCQRNESEEPVFCTLQATQGCTCYNNGTCAEGYVNACTDCGKDDVALVIEGGSCPENGIESRE